MSSIELIYHVPYRIQMMREFLRIFFRAIFRLLANVRVTGAENVPGNGPYIIAINHVSTFDPPFALAFWPVAAEAVGAADIWERRGQSTLARLYGGIQVHRGQYDRELIDTILSALSSGRPLLIAPEGGRTHTPGMRQALPGVAYVMDKAQVPVIPVGIVGATDDFLKRGLRLQRPTIQMHIGKPVSFLPVTGKGEERRLSRQKNADRIMQHIADLLPADYRGIYAGSSQPQALPEPK